MADNCISPPGDGGHDRPPHAQDDDPQQTDGALSLMRRARARWYWLLPAVAVVANVYGFVGFPDLTESEVPEAQAQPCHPHCDPPPTTPPSRPPCEPHCNPPPTTPKPTPTTPSRPPCEPHCNPPPTTPKPTPTTPSRPPCEPHCNPPPTTPKPTTTQPTTSTPAPTTTPHRPTPQRPSCRPLSGTYPDCYSRPTTTTATTTTAPPACPNGAWADGSCKTTCSTEVDGGAHGEGCQQGIEQGYIDADAVTSEPPVDGTAGVAVMATDFDGANPQLDFDADAFNAALPEDDKGEPPSRGETAAALCAGLPSCPASGSPVDQYTWLYEQGITVLTPDEFEARALEDVTTGQLGSFFHRIEEVFDPCGGTGCYHAPVIQNTGPSDPDCASGYNVIQVHVTSTDDGCRPVHCDFGRRSDGWCEPPSNADLPLIYVLGDTVGEAAGPARFRLRLSHAVPQPVTVRVDTRDGSANAGSDYTSVGRTATFAANLTVALVDVPVNDDTLSEPDEDFTMQLSSPSTNAELSTTLSADAVIVDDEIAPPGAVQNLALACAGPDAFGEFTLTATWDPPPDGAVRVQVEITDQANVNLYAISAGGTSPYTATVTAEGIYRVSTLPYLSGGLQGQASEAFVECPSLPEVSVAAAADVREGVALEFTVSLSAPSATDVTVEVVAVGITATEGVDFLTRSGTVTILAGATSKDVFVFSVADLDVEVDETLRLDLSSPTGALPSTAMSATGRILDDDEPTISVEGPGGPVEEDAPGPLPNSLTFTVSLDVAGVRAVTVNVTTTAGTATGGTCGSGNADYADQSTPITFNPGDLTKDFTVQTCPDTLSHEGTEDFTVTISNPTGGATIGNATATGRINDNDSPPIYR